ncbi:MAG: hypothetical protein R3C30_12750 [Hyphomonadaceae bacterium]
MRLVLVSLLALVLCACSQAAPDSSAVSVPPEPSRSVLSGDYKPASNTARAITGGMVVQRGGVIFDNGVVLYTRTLDPRRGGDLMAKNGDTYAAAVVGPGSLNVELRRVTEQVVPGGVVGLCGAEQPQYLALTYDERATVVTVLVFSGDEPPSRDALNSRVCARFGYAAPEGARTREGVVL